MKGRCIARYFRAVRLTKEGKNPRTVSKMANSDERIVLLEFLVSKIEQTVSFAQMDKVN